MKSPRTLFNDFMAPFLNADKFRPVELAKESIAFLEDRASSHEKELRLKSQDFIATLKEKGLNVDIKHIPYRKSPDESDHYQMTLEELTITATGADQKKHTVHLYNSDGLIMYLAPDSRDAIKQSTLNTCLSLITGDAQKPALRATTTSCTL